jgi:hypothetical protein
MAGDLQMLLFVIYTLHCLLSFRPAHKVQYKLNWTSQKPNRASNKRLKHDDDDDDENLLGFCTNADSVLKVAKGTTFFHISPMSESIFTLRNHAQV